MLSPAVLQLRIRQQRAPRHAPAALQRRGAAARCPSCSSVVILQGKLRIISTQSIKFRQESLTPTSSETVFPFQFLQQFVPLRNFSKDQIKSLRPASSAVAIHPSQACALLMPLFGSPDFAPNQTAAASDKRSRTPSASSSKSSALSFSQLQSPAPPALPPWSSPDFMAKRQQRSPDFDITAEEESRDLSAAVEVEVSALLGDLSALRSKAARSDAEAERLRHENSYLQQQVQLEMSSGHRSQLEQQRLHELLQRAQAQLAECRQREEMFQQRQESNVPLTLHDTLQQKAVALLQRSHFVARLKRMWRLWASCRRAAVLSRLPLRDTPSPAGFAARPWRTRQGTGRGRRSRGRSKDGNALRRCVVSSLSCSARWACSALGSDWASFSWLGGSRQLPGTQCQARFHNISNCTCKAAYGTSSF